MLFIRIRRFIRKNVLLTNIYHWLYSEFYSTLYSISPVLLVYYRYFLAHVKLPNLKNPRTFDEKLLWLMLYWRHPLKTKCGDKYAVRSYVEGMGLVHILNDCLGLYESPQQIDFENLPIPCVLKCTHGCRMNIFINNKNTLNIMKAEKNLNLWMKKDISKIFGELHYAGMKHRIICEPFLGDVDGNLPTDYKIFCFQGKAQFTLVCTNRRMGGSARYDYYDRDWTYKLSYSKSGIHPERHIPKPIAYDKMIKAAEILSKPFPFVRIDLYVVSNQIKFGEMTFTPAGCIDRGFTDEAQKILGDLIKLPDKILE